MKFLLGIVFVLFLLSVPLEAKADHCGPLSRLGSRLSSGAVALGSRVVNVLGVERRRTRRAERRSARQSRGDCASVSQSEVSGDLPGIHSLSQPQSQPDSLPEPLLPRALVF